MNSEMIITSLHDILESVERQKYSDVGDELINLNSLMQAVSGRD